MQLYEIIQIHQRWIINKLWATFMCQSNKQQMYSGIWFKKLSISALSSDLYFFNYFFNDSLISHYRQIKGENQYRTSYTLLKKSSNGDLDPKLCYLCLNSLIHQQELVSIQLLCAWLYYLPSLSLHQSQTPTKSPKYIKLISVQLATIWPSIKFSFNFITFSFKI